MLPNNSKLYISSQKKDYLYLDNTMYSPKTYYERGGVDLSDPSLGLFFQTWYLRYDTKRFLIRSEDGKEYVLKTLPKDIELIKVSFSFDQNMRLVWGYTEKDFETEEYKSFLYWFDTTINDYREVAFENCRDITIKLDDPREITNTTNDVTVLYIDKANWLTVRYQRDRYTKPYKLLRVPEESVVTKVGLTKDYRFQIELRTVESVKHKDNKFIIE